LGENERGRLTQEQKRQLLDFLNASQFYRYMQMEALDAEDGRSSFRLTVKDDFKNLYGILHGGVIATILDSTCSIAVASLLEPGEFSYTLDQRVNYIGNVRSGVLHGQGKTIHKGRKTAVSEGEIRDDDGNLIAFGVNTLFLFRHQG
jgi:uncharacterized protein (TIGR00369 family)